MNEFQQQPKSLRTTMRYITAFATAVAFLVPAVANAQASSRRPNIIWIVAENFSHEFGCYGAENVRTPNVDRLAAGGVRYTNVFSTSPVCARADLAS